MDTAQIESMLGDFRRNLNIIQATGIGQLFGPAYFPSFLGKSLALMCGATGEQDDTLSRYLSTIPSETTLNERRLLYNFFLNFWDGKLDVLEVGPFLGGTSRAIALGMLHSGNREGSVKLFTYDKFRDYYQPERLLTTLAPMFEAGILGDETRDLIRRSNRFKEVFDLLHRGHDYAELLEAHVGALPSAPDEPEDPESTFALPDGRTYSAVFVDGAKSWFGTKRFMTLALAHTGPGAYYIFQDYGAHTCFWIPVFLELMKKKFQLVAYIDHTYVYRQQAPVAAAEIDAVFPDSPLAFSVADFARIFRNLYATALETDNTYTLLNFQLQHAAALGYLGHKEAARDRIVDLLKTPHALQHRHWILNALRTPTYTPEGYVDLF